jgi:hypothetical protein
MRIESSDCLPSSYAPAIFKYRGHQVLFLSHFFSLQLHPHHGVEQNAPVELRRTDETRGSRNWDLAQAQQQQAHPQPHPHAHTQPSRPTQLHQTHHQSMTHAQAHQVAHHAPHAHQQAKPATYDVSTGTGSGPSTGGANSPTAESPENTASSPSIPSQQQRFQQSNVVWQPGFVADWSTEQVTFDLRSSITATDERCESSFD